jgi:hypothetical protein
MIPTRVPRFGAPPPRSFLAIGMALSIGALGACDRPKEPEPTKVEPAVTVTSAAPAAAQPAPAAPSGTSGIQWADPSRWQRLPATSPMRKASYKVPKQGSDPEDGELSVFHFGKGEGGGIEPNVERWVGQFKGIDKQQVKRTDRSANGLVQHVVEIESGTFSSGMPGGPTTPKENFALLGAIVEAPNGNWFFKLTGPKATVKRAHPEFFGLLDSAKAQ